MILKALKYILLPILIIIVAASSYLVIYVLNPKNISIQLESIIRQKTEFNVVFEKDIHWQLFPKPSVHIESARLISKKKDLEIYTTWLISFELFHG